MPQMSALNDGEIFGLVERLAQVARGRDVGELELLVAELKELRRQIAVLPARTNILMMSAAIASELSTVYDVTTDDGRKHVALTALQLALKLEELVPR